MSNDISEAALNYHKTAPAGKLTVVATKPLANQHDLALAYTPGVAVACNEIVRDPNQASAVTARANLVAVITNGTAVLGLGAIGPLAAKPVMEGKAVLFKKFAGIDVFDIEIDERDPHKLVDIIASLEPTFGGINLEDIKAPECFIVERELKKRLKIPVFHDDQHGTAIIVGAAILNGLRIVEKDIHKVKLVASGAGAAALACLDLLVSLGLRKENIFIVDSQGVVHAGRAKGMEHHKASYAQDTDARTLTDALVNADIFLGLSVAGVLKPKMVGRMVERPIILALSNPVPEIFPEEARAVRPNAIIATGRSDYPNQVNNVLCFPYIFRGALDVGATTINEEMKIAGVNALADLAMTGSSEVVATTYGEKYAQFGPDSIIPKPFDRRLIRHVSEAVAKAAMESGVAQRPIKDFEVYQQRLDQYVFRSGFVMKPIFDRAKKAPKRLVYAEGEERRVLQVVQQVLNEGIAEPIVVGRPEVVESRLQELGLSIRPGKDFELTNPLKDDRFREYWTIYHQLLGRSGASPEQAKMVVRTQSTVIAALMVYVNDADAMLCGTVGAFNEHLRHVVDVIGKDKKIHAMSTLIVLILPSGTFFICDSHVNPDPSAIEIAEMTQLAANEVRRFGVTPKVAMLSHSNFGAEDTASARKIREALYILHQQEPDFEVEGEMHADVALSEELRQRVFPDSHLKGQANLFVMPNLDAAHIAYNLLKMLGGGVCIGPILIGTARPVHIVTSSTTTRGLLNMSALAVAGAQTHESGQSVESSHG